MAIIPEDRWNVTVNLNLFTQYSLIAIELVSCGLRSFASLRMTILQVGNISG